jgi:hypothetical protein
MGPKRTDKVLASSSFFFPPFWSLLTDDSASQRPRLVHSMCKRGKQKENNSAAVHCRASHVPGQARELAGWVNRRRRRIKNASAKGLCTSFPKKETDLLYLVCIRVAIFKRVRQKYYPYAALT